MIHLPTIQSAFRAFQFSTLVLAAAVFAQCSEAEKAVPEPEPVPEEETLPEDEKEPEGETSPEGEKNPDGENKPEGDTDPEGDKDPEPEPEPLPPGVFFAKGVSKSSGWYDVNKKGDGRTEEGDATMCWAASAANMLQWWQDRYREMHGSLPAAAVTGVGKKYELAIFELYQRDWVNMHGSEVYYGIPWYFTGENRGKNAVLTAQPKEGTGGYWSAEWPNLESQMGTDYVPYLQSYYGWGPERPDQSKQPLDIVTELVVKGMKEGIVSLSITVGYSIQHAITLWGYEVDGQGKISKMYVTDSDDLIDTPSTPRVQLLNEYNVLQKGNEVVIENGKNSFQLSQITRLKAIFSDKKATW